MFKNIFLIIVNLIAFLSSYSQKSDSLIIHYRSIFEYGDSIKDCQTNFKNLINNWQSAFITNANEFEFIKCTFIEEITDSSRYNFYRNYFSSNQSIGATYGRVTSTDSKGMTSYTQLIRPRLKYQQIYDPRILHDSMQIIYSSDFCEKAKRLLDQEFSIDTIKLNYYTFSQDSIYADDKHSGHQSKYWDFYSPDSLTQDYFDVAINHTKTLLSLDLENAQKIILQDLLIQRILEQIYFTDQVSLNDKVFKIVFKYNNHQFSTYIICSAQTNKVVLGSIFDGLRIKTTIN